MPTRKKAGPTRKPALKAKAKAKPKPRPRTRSRAAEAYTRVVAEGFAAEPRQSSFRPKVELDLTVVRAREPRTPEELAPAERAQLEVLFHPEPLAKVLANEEYCFEAAEVVDATGALRFRLYGWNYGVGYLFPPEGMEVVAFGSQHDLEHWRLEQRDLFWAMDRAMRKKGHGFQQPLEFCWWKDGCWEEIEGEAPGTVGSEPHLRKAFAAARAALDAGR